MASCPELIYCANGNARFAKIAIEAGFTYGAQMPGTVYFPPQFVDQNWKNPDQERYMQALELHRPHMASVLDLEHEAQFDEVMAWAEGAAVFVEVVMIIPKVFGIVPRIPRRIGGADVRIGYSVPTKHGATELPVWEFAGRPVHLLGGSPHAQIRLAKYMDVISVDGNMAHSMANNFCAFWDPTKSTRRGIWPTLKDYDGKPWGDGSDKADAPYEAFRRSCENIMGAWRG
jgi:hypothetical protein